jgi:uncharacterized membrane protein
MLMATLYSLHVFAVMVWIGGMFFAHMALRPTAATVLQPPERLTLLAGVFARFFIWVKVSIVLLFVSGLWLINIHGSFVKAGWHVHLMFLIAVIMTIIFGVIYAVPFKALKAAVAAKQWPAGGSAMAQIRKLVGINLILGLFVIVIGVSGRYLG